MEYITINRKPEERAFQQLVAIDTLEAMCKRAFGQDICIETVRELGNGEHNTTYLIHMAGLEPVVLRVAPHTSLMVSWHTRYLMRKEHSLQPFFAPIAPLMPKTLMIDFTHQLIDRDYMFQEYKQGELWSAIMDDLTPEENDELWRQFGRICRKISNIQGAAFGLPHPGPQFPTWSLTVLDWLERAIHDAEGVDLDMLHLRRIQEMASAHTHLLDEIVQPRLMHGDLWPFNVLVERGESGPSIVAVLDADRGGWGDPLSDWTFFLLARRVSPAIQELFWQEYGRPEDTIGARFRAKVYESLHHGNAIHSLKRRNYHTLIPKAHGHLQDIVLVLQNMLG